MMKIEEIISELKKHNITPEKLQEVRKAYLLAAEIHKNQYRQSGEPYINHPLEAASILLSNEVYDPDTISAALLHDTIEDAEYNFTKKDIAKIINPTVADLVDGVTKISKMNFSTKHDKNLANTRKIITGLNKDIRIILIKLADRLHNMRTLASKSIEKQIENSQETMDLFVPLALTLGAYKTKSELEDLALKYLAPNTYNEIKKEKNSNQQIIKDKDYIEKLRQKLEKLLQEKNIPGQVILRSKNYATIYRQLKQGYEIENIYDLYYIKIIVDTIEDCYKTLALVHQTLPPLNGRFKDYIYNQRTNSYQSLHTTVSSKAGKLIKIKIRTKEMDKVAANGLSAYWNLENGKTIAETQNEIREKSQFAKKLHEIDEAFQDNHKFYEEIRCKLLIDHVYVYNSKGEIVELPTESRAIDYVCHTNPNLLDQMTGILINGKEVSLNHLLKNNDLIEVRTTGLINKDNFELTPKPKIYQKVLKCDN